MSRSGRVWLAVLLVAAAATATATGGFTAVTADRGADVVVAGDDVAYLGIDLAANVTLGPGRHEVTLLALTNRLAEPLTNVTVTVREPSRQAPSHLSVVTPATLAPGGTANVTVGIACGGAATERWELTIAVAGTDTDVTAVREVTVTCEVTRGGPPDGAGPAGGQNGSGTASVDGSGTTTGTETATTTETETETATTTETEAG